MALPGTNQTAPLTAACGLLDVVVFDTRSVLVPATVVSMLCSLWIIYMYKVNPRMRMHPNTIILHKAMIDLVWGVCVLIPQVTSDSYCFCETDWGRPVSFLTMATDVASNMLFIMIAVDLMLSS